VIPIAITGFASPNNVNKINGVCKTAKNAFGKYGAANNSQLLKPTASTFAKYWKVELLYEVINNTGVT
jgi:hypothetical protein